jgi:hypothetical protein
MFIPMCPVCLEWNVGHFTKSLSFCSKKCESVFLEGAEEETHDSPEEKWERYDYMRCE